MRGLVFCLFVAFENTKLSEKGRNEVDLGRVGRVVNIIKIHHTKLENLKDFKKRRKGGLAGESMDRWVGW